MKTPLSLPFQSRARSKISDSLVPVLVLHDQFRTAIMDPKRLRISHACDRCRAMRTKCSGAARCERCTKDEADCRYSDRRREQNQKNFSDKNRQIQILTNEKLLLVDRLRNVGQSSTLSPTEKTEISSIVDKFTTRPATSKSGPQSRSPGSSSGPSFQREEMMPDQAPASAGGFSLSSEVGSPHSQGEINQLIDLGGGSGAVGYIGRMSATSWLRRIYIYLQDSGKKSIFRHDNDEADSRASETLPRLTYFMNEEELLSINEDNVDENLVPPREVCLLLGEAYFYSTQAYFPFLRRRSFFSDLKQIFSWDFPSTFADRRLLALYNMVWATGARWLQTAGLPLGSPIEGHQIYYARARALGLDHRIMFDQPDVYTLQGLGVLSFYLLVNGSLQRAWNVLGQAVRHAVSVGLHLRIVPQAADDDERDKRRALWRAFYLLETQLAEMLGRPISVQSPVSDLLSFLPRLEPESVSQDMEEVQLNIESSSAWVRVLAQYHVADEAFQDGSFSIDKVGGGFSDSYRSATYGLSLVTGEICRRIYTDLPRQTWHNVQTTIGEMENVLEYWTDNLPKELHLQNADKLPFDPRPVLELAMHRSNVRMLLYRPCLCEISIDTETSKHNEFTALRARLCVEAALEMVSLIPDNPAVDKIFYVLPWWSTLHYLCQAGSVLLLEICLDLQHFQTEVAVIESALNKVLAYLWILCYNSKSALKAYYLIRLFSDKALARLELGLSPKDLGEPPLPRGWDESDSATLLPVINFVRESLNAASPRHTTIA